jgi:hypothetical protein
MIIIAGFFDGIIVLNPYGALFLILTCFVVVLRNAFARFILAGVVMVVSQGRLSL